MSETSVHGKILLSWLCGARAAEETPLSLIGRKFTVTTLKEDRAGNYKPEEELIGTFLGFSLPHHDEDRNVIYTSVGTFFQFGKELMVWHEPFPNIIRKTTDWFVRSLA